MTAALTLSQVVQLYAPLAGLALLAFWVGGLSERMKRVERDATKTGDEGDSVRDKVTRLEVEMGHANTKLDGICRDMQVAQRQLANIATGRAGASIYELGSTQHGGPAE